MTQSAYSQVRVAVRRTLFLCASSLVVAGIALPEQVSAQEAAAPPALEEITVTARRRSENLQDVPVAISALSAADIAQRGIATESDLQVSVPGLMVRVTNSSNQLNFSLRGQSVDSFSNSQPAVLTYVNEVQVGGVTSSAFFDLESIQVLKGPQGTLFGRNATGGAVLYQTKQPDDVLDGYLRVGFGNYNNQEVEGVFNTPLGESWALRLAGLVRERDGWQKNLFNGDELASIDTKNVRLSLSFDGDSIDNRFVAYYGDHGGKTEGLKVRNAYNNGDTNPNTGVPVGDVLFATDLYPAGSVALLGNRNPRIVELGAQLGFTGFGEFITAQKAVGFYDVMNDQSNLSDIEHTLVTNSTSFDWGESVTIKNIFGYNNVESFQATDIDGSPFMMLRMGDETTPDGGYTYNTEQLSDELQFSGKLLSDKLDYIFGLYYYTETFENKIPLKFIADFDGDPFGPAFAYHAEIENESKSFFMQGTYALTDSLNVTAGYRHTWEEVSIQHLPDDVYYQSAGLTGKFTTEEDKPSWLVSLDYRLNADNMVYLAHRGSWRTGGFNVTSINVTPDGVVPDSFKPETTWDIEAGYKFSGMLGSVPSRINLAVYEQVIEDVQRTVYLQITSQTGNVAEAKVTGVELDTQFDVTDWLQVGATYAYTDARFTDPVGDVIGYTFEFGPYADAPENMWSLYFLTQTAIDRVGNLTFRGDFYSTDDTYFSNLNDSIGPGTELEGYELLNLRVALEDIAGTRFSAAAFVSNATDEEYERGGLPLAGVTATNATVQGAPRTYGIEVKYEF